MAIQAQHKENGFGIGDVVRVHILVADKANTEKGSRTQVFEGTVIGIKGRGNGKSFTVRRIGAQKIGIEQIFPLYSPILDKVEVVREGKRGSRQAKLYYTRHKSKREIETIYSRAKRKAQKTETRKAEPKKKVVKKSAKKSPKKASKKS